MYFKHLYACIGIFTCYTFYDLFILNNIRIYALYIITYASPDFDIPHIYYIYIIYCYRLYHIDTSVHIYKLKLI